MKRNTDKQIGFASNVIFEGYDAKISESDMDKLWDLLQDPYKNPVGAVVREYVSNSFDSHAEAKFIKEHTVEEIRSEYSIYNNYTDEYILELKKQLQSFDDDPVVVTIGKDDTGYYWSTEDVGVGLSPERVKDVFCSYLKSTKEDTNNLIGAFGIGSKSGLSYTDVVYIRTRYNGVEYFYLLRKGEKSPRLDKVMEIPTEERNGTEIKIYIKEVKPYASATYTNPETNKFEEECKKQLAYFDNVYFVGMSISNNYTILQGDNWKYSTKGSPFSGLHMCLGKVAYPIDWDSLGCKHINLPLALHFEIGELDIIQTREDVKYTPKTKEAILNKIEALKQELKTRWYNDNDYLTEDLFTYLQNRGNTPYLTFRTEQEKVNITISPIFNSEELRELDYQFKPFVDIGFNFHAVNKGDIFFEYNVPSYLGRTGLKHSNTSVYWTLLSESPIYRIEGNHDPKKSKYICNVLEGGENVFLIRKSISSVTLNRYKAVLGLKNYPKSEWRTIISTYQKEIKKAIIKRTKSYKNVIVDSEWLKGLKKSRFIDNSVFNAYNIIDYSVDKTKLQKSNIDGSNNLYIVGTKEDVRWLRAIRDFFKNRMSTRYFNVMYVAPTNAKYFRDVKYLINPLNYMKHRAFIKECTIIHILNDPKYKILRSLDTPEELYNIATSFEKVNSKVSKAFFAYKSAYEKTCSDTKRLSDSIDYSMPVEYDSIYNLRSLLVNVYFYLLENDGLDKELLAQADFICDYLENIPLIKHVDLSRINSEELAKAIYRFNKSVPIKFRKRMNPMYYVDLNAEEVSWLSQEESNIYKSLKLI